MASECRSRRRSRPADRRGRRRPKATSTADEAHTAVQAARELRVRNLSAQAAQAACWTGECGYNHDLREVTLHPPQKGRGQLRWKFSRDPKAATITDARPRPVDELQERITRGALFDYRVSHSTPARGMNLGQGTLPESDPRRHETTAANNTSLIRPRSLTITSSTTRTRPRPSAGSNWSRAPRASISGYPDRVSLRGRPQPEQADRTGLPLARLGRHHKLRRRVRPRALQEVRRDRQLVVARRHGLHRGFPVDARPANRPRVRSGRL